MDKREKLIAVIFCVLLMMSFRVATAKADEPASHRGTLVVVFAH